MIRAVGPSAEKQSNHAARLVALSLVDAHPLVRVAAAAATIRADNTNPVALAILDDGRRRRGNEIGQLASTVWAVDLDSRYKRILMDTPPGNREAPSLPSFTGRGHGGVTWWRPDGSFSAFLRDENVLSSALRRQRAVRVVGLLQPPSTRPDRPRGRLGSSASRRLARFGGQQAELEKPPDFIAHSYGASVAMSATRVKKHVRGLVLLSPAVHATCVPNPSTTPAH